VVEVDCNIGMLDLGLVETERIGVGIDDDETVGVVGVVVDRNIEMLNPVRNERFGVRIDETVGVVVVVVDRIESPHPHHSLQAGVDVVVGVVLPVVEQQTSPNASIQNSKILHSHLHVRDQLGLLDHIASQIGVVDSCPLRQ
jgi:hypothetical protein